MMTRVLAKWTAALAACLLLGACGNSKKSFDDSFNQDFHQKFAASCIQSATAGGVAQSLAVKLCGCAADKVDQRFSVSEKMQLTQARLKPIMLECKASIPG